MSEPELCQRCQGPIAKNRAVLRLDTGEPGSEPQEFTVCERCLTSYLKWTTRRRRHSGSRSASAKAAEALKKKSDRLLKALDGAPSDPPRKSRRTKTKKRFRVIGLRALLIVATLALIALIVYFLLLLIPAASPNPLG